MRSYVVLGTGAVGGLYGGWLQKAGFPVRFLARSDFQAIRDHGLEIRSPRGNVRFEQVEVYGKAADMPPGDVALVAWKTTSNRVLKEILPAVLKPGGRVVVLQNGLYPETEAAAALPSARIISGLCFLCCRKDGPTVVEHQDYGSITLAPYGEGFKSAGEIPAWVREVSEDFQRAGVEIRLETDWKTARWKKLVWNVPFNGLCALHGVDTGKILENPEWLATSRELMSEVLAGAGLAGVAIDPSFAEQMMQYTRAMRPYEPSMKLDRDAGKAMELQAIYADPLADIGAHGGKAPAMAALYAALLGIQSSLR